MDKSSTVVEQLKNMVGLHLEMHPNLSLNAISKRASVSGTTLRRIMNSANSSEPAPHVILNLVSYLKKEKSLSGVLHNTDGPIGERLNECFGQFIEESISYSTTEEIEESLQDHTSYIIYKLASHHSGTTKMEVQSLYGVTGLKVLEELCKKGLLKENGHYFHAVKKNFSLTLETAKRHLPHLVSLYKPEELNLKKNLFYSQSESLNTEAIKLIKDIHRNAAVKIHKIMSNEENHGSTPYFSINLSETLLPNDGQEEDQRRILQ